MMRTSYSPIFSEGLDFCCLILDRDGELVAMQNLNPAMMGQALYSGRWVIDDLGADSFEPGDVVVHNDPYRGGSHMPEHLLDHPLLPRRRAARLGLQHRARRGDRRHGARLVLGERDRDLPGGSAAAAGEALPARRAGPGRMADHAREPPHARRTRGATSTRSIGSLRVGLRRLEALYDEHGAARIETADARPLRLRRGVDQARHRRPPRRHVLGRGLPGGRRLRQAQPTGLRVDLTIAGDQMVVDWSRTDPQARGTINAPYPVTASATYAGIFQVIGSGAPINAGAIRPIDIVAPPGTVVNVRHPGACVGGQTELQPRIVDLIQGRVLSQVAPERCSAASGGTSGNFLFGGIHPRTGEYYTHYHFEGNGWGGRASDRRQQRADRPARQLPQHARRGLRDALPVVYRVLPAQRGRRRSWTHAGWARDHEAASCRGGRDRRERALRPLEGSSLGRLSGATTATGLPTSCGPQARVASVPSRRHSARPATRSSRTCDSTVATSSCCGRRPGAGTAPRGSGHRSTSPRTWWRGTSVASAPQPATASSSGRTAPSIRPVPSARGPS